MKSLLHRFPILACVIALALLSPVFAQQVPGVIQFRGPSAEGPSAGGDLPDGEFGLKVGWKRDLGSGYSHVWIADGKAVTMFTSGEVDVVGAFRPSDGEELWRYELGPKYAGHDGSDDGPIGTPTVGDGVVYALGPHGQFVALSLEDGSEKWKRTLDETNSTEPHYGYTTSPILFGKLVLLATGGEGHAVTAFDRATGKTVWTAGDDAVQYQTPMLVEFGGRAQLITVTNHELMGIDPTGGEVLWRLRHSEDAQRAPHPTMLDGDRFLFAYNGGGRLYRWNGEGVEEVWQTRAFGNTYALPVLVDDHFYGFSGNILTCVDAGTGEIVWRSRALSSFGLSAVDGKLAILTRDGELVLVDASPEGYREFTRVNVFDNGNYAVPVYADGRFLLRNLAELAAVEVDRSLTPRIAETEAKDRLLGPFGAWVKSVEALPESERQAAVDRRFASVETTPIFGEDGWVTLVWRGDARDVGVRGDITGDAQELGLYRLEGSDLFFRSVQLDPKAQYTYSYLVDFGNPVPDPRNPYTVDAGFFVLSEIRMPEWPASPHLDAPADDAPRGTLDRFQFRSEILDNTREIQLWRPADYDRDPETRYPVLVVNHGDNLLRGGLMRNVLDNRVGETTAPLIAVFVPRLSGAEYGGPAAENYMRFLVEELLPHVDRHYRTDPGDRAIMGPGSAGVAAVLAAFTHPDVFRRASVQSFYPIEPAFSDLPGIIASAETKPELVYVVWSRHDYDFGPDRNSEIASGKLLEWLRGADVRAIEQVADYSPGWGGWRGQYDEILEALFPMPAED